MAETKKATKARKAKPRKPASRKSSNSSKSKAARGAKSAGSKASSSSNGASGSSVKETVVNGAHGAANGIAPVAQKAKLPLLATGAALAGAAAVIASKTGNQRKVLGVKVPKRSKVHLPDVHLPKGKGIKADVRKAAGAVSDAANQADELGKRISKVANSVKTVSETANDAAKKS